MNQQLSNIGLLIQQSALTDNEKQKLLKEILSADKQLSILEFKLDRTEKVKKTTGVLLEETIDELEKRRKDVEAQNLELEIESSLERVRTVAMSMSMPDDLLSICETMFHELEKSGFSALRNTMIDIHYDDKGYLLNYDYAEHTGKTVNHYVYNSHPVIDNLTNHARQSSGAFTEMVYSGETLNEWRAFRKKNGEADDPRLDNIDALYYYFYSIGTGAIGISTFSAANEEKLNVLKRFRNVFDLAYKRYIDIINAEAQAREAQIQLALERVRAVAMSMKEPADMLEICSTICNQLQALNVKEVRNVQTAIFYESKGTYMNYEYYAKHEKTFITETSFINHKMHREFAVQMLKGKGEFFTTYISKTELPDWIAYQKTTNVFIDTFLETANSLTYYWYSLGPVALGISTYAPLNEEETNLFKRFLKVFELSYTRYLDIEQAIAQTRESQIQLALERVRARTMAMQHSDELSEMASEMFRQIQLLGLKTWSCGFNIIDKEHCLIRQWVSTGDGRILPAFVTPSDEDVFQRFTEAAQQDKSLYVEEMGGEVLKAHYHYMASLPEVKKLLDEFQSLEITPPDLQVFHLASFSYGYLMFITYQPAPEFYDVFKRFAIVFDQTYRRFLDLQNAEAQTRESQIQLALERVRARTMAMHKSNELADTASVLFQQIKELGFETWSCGFCIWTKNDLAEVWMAADSGGLLPPMMIPYKEESTHAEIYKATLRGEPAHNKIWEGEELEKHYAFLKTIPSVKTAIDILEKSGLTLPLRQCYYVGFFKEGYLLLITKDPNEGLKDLSKRFASVFDLTYTRFLDLQKAEAQAREAQIEAALERVRSRTLAMQKSDELAETSAVLFKQLIGLGISPNRLYISIIKDDEGETEFWITDEDGSKVSMAYEDNLNNNPSFKKMFDGWKRQKKSLVLDMKGEDLDNYFNYLSSIHVPFKGGLAQKRRLQYIAYFSKGFIGMASPDEQSQQTVDLLERFAYVFNLTFTRFNDLKVAEAHAIQAEEDLIKLQTEKRRAEDALTELKETQKQLVQSEKMASLGELTAGIAHEIQNPLNFVNNFSEVNKEMLEELKAERLKPNADKTLEAELINDIIANEEKINHHGKRADAIVKNMLQHSRKNSGQKEPTDTNALCDEYLRLSFHGLRAKDKSFNADFKTDFDESIGKINIVPQDIGRVLLNLYNNAFYAVSEKLKAQSLEQNAEYKPLVSVATRKINSPSGAGGIEIVVSDNGNGIPQNIIDKIFQPFFTTKRTGEGTGLGLSLAYDIITKEHNGTIKAESEEGEGSTFIILLS